jgi:hypothetical protein
MTEDDIRNIVRETVYETLSGLGMAAHEQQELQADFIYVRKIRKSSEALSGNVRASIITVFIPTILYVLWQAVKGEVWK